MTLELGNNTRTLETRKRGGTTPYGATTRAGQSNRNTLLQAPLWLS